MHRVADSNRRAHLVPVGNAECEPTAAELEAIEAEWPVIAAELAVTAAEIMLLTAPTSHLAWRAHRDAVRHLLAVLRDLANRSTFPSGEAA